MTSWIEKVRFYDGNMLLLDQSYEKIEPKSIKITLLDHQTRTVKAMLDLERKRFLNVAISRGFQPITGIKKDQPYYQAFLETQAGVLSEKPGSGKTFEILAVICEQPQLKLISEILSLPIIQNKVLSLWSFSKRTNFTFAGFTCEIRKIYDRVIKSNLIFVGKSVLAQWCETIETYTNLSVFVINNINDLKKFYNMIFTETGINLSEVNKYDIILVKNGTITAPFNPKEFEKSGIKPKSILAIFGYLFKDICWNRVILDDFDIFDLARISYCIPALFTWFISATRKRTNKKNNSTTLPKNSNHSIEYVLNEYRPNYSWIWDSIELFTFCNISCTENFINESTRASKVDYFVYKFKNPNETFINMIGNMGPSIAEMLNSDSIQTASNTVGIKTNSVADIFEKILNNNWEAYHKLMSVEKYIKKVMTYFNEIDFKELNFSDKKINRIKRNIKRPGPFKDIKKNVKHRNDQLTDLVEDIKKETKFEKDEKGKALQRVKDNLKSNECPVLFKTLSECEGIVVLRCCGIAISKEASEMIFKTSKVNCLNCRTPIDITGIILIDRTFIETKEMDNILDEDALDENDEVEESSDIENEIGNDDETDETDEVEEIKENLDEKNKINCLLKIILGLDLSDVDYTANVPSKPEIPGLLVGDTDLGFAPENKKKILIFNNYNESTIAIEKKLKHYKISFIRLQGSNSQIKEIVRRYQLDNEDPESYKVLIISGPKFCAGLNLQNTTDLIFMHKIIDKAIESQISGRAARYGRVYNLKIHFILYENEYYNIYNIPNIPNLNRNAR